MTPDNLLVLKKELARDEGVRFSRYKDTKGYNTIGVGHNIDVDKHYIYTETDEPLNLDQVYSLLGQDLEHVFTDLDRNVPWWRSMNDVRQRVIANMCFNLGWTRLSAFRNTLKAMQTGNYRQAADGMMGSLWAAQVKDRAKRLADMMEYGV